MSRTTIADLVAQTLAGAGVERLWGVTGDSLNGIGDSLRRLGKIEWMHVRNEEAGAFAASAEAAVTGRLAVCAGSCGPGNLHLINGLFEAQRSQTPVLAIAAHIPSTEIGLGYFQETHPQHLFKECSHYAELVTHPAQIRQVLETAIRVAIQKRGVSVIVLPGDIALLDAPDGAVLKLGVPATPVVLPSESELARLATLLNASGAVTLMCGAGCAQAHDQVVALADRLAAPAVHAMRGKEYVEWDNPFDVGMTGFVGFSSGYHAMMSCDTLVLLGTDFPYRQFYPKRSKVVQIDIRPEVLGRRTPLEMGLIGDVAASIEALLPRLDNGRDRSFLASCKAHYVKARAQLDDLATPRADDRRIHPQYIARMVSEIASDNAIFAVDVGTPTLWAARYLEMNGKRRLLGSFNHGSMANALPQAMGAQAAFPGRQVVTLSGDGGFSMLMGDVLSLKQLNLPVKIVLLNNSSLGFVAMEMKAQGYIDYATDLENPNFAELAKAIGILGLRVSEPAALEGALRQGFAHDGPALIEVMTAKQELSMPPTIGLEQVKGFGLFMLKAIVNGRGDEILELAETNLRF